MKSLRLGLGAIVGSAVLIAACGGETREEPATTQEVTAAPDTTGAGMWAYLQAADYHDNWDLWPDKGQLYTGQQPHGMLLTTYLNDVAMGALTSGASAMPEGAIIVKENYMPDSTLAAVTTMYKVSGYNADHNDWFFTKHLPSGALDTMPNGMGMEGRVPGCQACHSGQRANDYIFTATLGGGQ